MIALVTGASGGIGLELARCLAADGHRLALVARGEEQLRARAEELSATAYPCDLSDPDAAIALFERVTRELGPVDLLVNNAGFGARGPFAESERGTALEMVRLNVGTVVALTRCALPGMLARGRGRILNVASTAALQPGPGMAVYFATKAFVLSFSEAISEELRGSPVTVTALCPGPTRTDFGARADIDDTRLFAVPWVMEAAAVSRIGYRGMMRGKPVVISGWPNRLLAFGNRLSPRWLTRRIAAGLTEKD